MASRKLTPRRKKTRHGATQPEDARTNSQVLLRLSPVVRDILRDQSEVQDLTLSRLVSFLVLEAWGDQYEEGEAELEAQRKAVQDAMVMPDAK
jgi:hypothetical protein